MLTLIKKNSWLFVLATAVSLGGCALSPGMYMAPVTKTLAKGTKASEEAPVGVLIPITPDLIRSQREARDTPEWEKIKHLIDEPKPYRIGAGDILNIVVWNHPDLALPPAGPTMSINEPGASAGVANGYNVSQSGTIQLPYAGAVAVAGLTEDQAQELLVKHLSRYLKDPQITVRIQSYRSARVYLEGQVRSPGLQTINDIPLTLPESISRAGGTLPSADTSQIWLSRAGKNTRIDLPQMVKAGINPSGILLQPGDMVRVASLTDSRVYVLGEVIRPTVLPMQTGGRLTLNEALGEASGVSSFSGDPKQIYVLRADGGENPQIFHLNASSPVAYAMAEGFQLQARDVVYVDPVPLVRWNRVISLILPSSSALTTWQGVMINNRNLGN